MDFSQRGVKFSPHSIVFERKFDTALRKSHGVEFLKRLHTKDLSNKDQVILTHAKNMWENFDPSQLITNHNVFPDFFLSIIDTDSKPDKETPTYLKRVSRIVRRNLDIQLAWINKNNGKKLKGNSGNVSIDTISTHSVVQKLVRASKLLEQLVNKLPSQSIRRKEDDTDQSFSLRKLYHNSYKNKILKLSCVWNANSTIIRFKDSYYYLPKSYLLMIHNKICDILSVVVYSFSAQHLYPDDDMVNIVIEFIKMWARYARTMQSKFFMLAKILEALCIGETLIKVEGRRNAGFLQTLVHSCEDIGFDYESSELQSFLITTSHPLRHELACLSKIMGHPFCDVVAGAKDLQEKTCTPTPINVDAVMRCVRSAKKNFLERYFGKHGRYPPCNVEPQCPRPLREMLLRNKNWRSIKNIHLYGAVTYEMFDFLELRPLAEFDLVENFIPYIKDRTVSLCRSKVLNKYFSDRQDPDDPNEWKDTRLLLAYLVLPAEKMDHIPHLRAYMREEWDEISDYMVIRVVPKEKELKENARGFGCMHMYARAKNIIQELNSGRWLHQYSDEQAMTLDEITLIKKIHAYQRLNLAYPGYSIIWLNLDASSWNNRFRHEAVSPICDALLDSYYGTNMFKNTQIAYQKTLVYVPDAGEIQSWDGQLGGIEGLNQDTWVTVYIEHTRTALNELPYDHYIFCKGDDLRVALLIPPEVVKNETIDSIRTRVLKHVSGVAKQFGHQIKVSDSYGSSCYFAFSKDAYLNYVEMPQTFRKIQKAYGSNNAFLCTLDDYIASSFSNCHSASRYGPSPVSCYTVALFWGYYHICDHVAYKNLSDTNLTALLLVPNILGGFPIIYLHNYFTRAESDLFSSFIDLYMCTAKLYPEESEVLSNWCIHDIGDVRGSLVGLCCDIFSLPLVKPESAQTYIRKSIKNVIESKTGNELLRQLQAARDTGFQDTLMDILYSANVYNGKLMSTVYAASPESVIDELCRKFESGRSILDALIIQQGYKHSIKILRACIRKDNKLHNFRIKKTLEGTGEENIIKSTDWNTNCSAECAQRVRDRLWRKPVESVTQPCVMHLVGFHEIEDAQRIPHALNNHFDYHFESTTTRRPSDVLFTATSKPPFAGHTTGKGILPPVTPLLSKNILALKIRELLDAYRWASMQLTDDEGEVWTSNFPQLIDQLVMMYTGKHVIELAPFTGRRSLTKTIQQRMKANNFRISIVPNTCSNIYTQSTGDSHSHISLAESTEHFRVNYLQIFCQAVSIWSLKPWCGFRPCNITRIWGVTTECRFCLKPIIEHPVIVRVGRLPKTDLVSVCTIGAKAMQEIQEEVNNYEAPEYYISDDAYDNLSYEEACAGLITFAIDKTYQERHILQTVYLHGHHMKSSAAQVLQNWSGQNSKSCSYWKELKYVPIRLLFESISWIVFTDVIQLLANVNLNDDPFSAISLMPSEELPWTCFLVAIFGLGRLYELQQYIYVEFSKLTVVYYDNPVSFAPTFGVCCYNHILSCTSLPNIILSKWSLGRESPQGLIRRMIGVQYYVFKSRYIAVLKQSIESGISISITDYAQCLMACYVTHPEELYQTWLQANETVETGEINVMEWNRESLEDVIPFGNDPDYHPPLQVLLMRAFPKYDWDLVYNQVLSESGELWDLSVNKVERTWSPYVCRITYADPENCLEKVRMHRPDVVQEHNPFIDPAARLRDIAMVRTCHHTRLDCREPLSLISANMNIKFDLQEAPRVIEPLTNRWSRRIAGTGNISMSRLIDLLDVIQLPTLADDGVYVCLADGHGGFLSVINAMTRNSTLVFNTKPNTIGVTPVPIVSSVQLEARQNVIDQYLLNVGVYDLALPSTMERLISRHPSVTMVTLDIETVPLSDPARILSINNVMRYATNVLAPQGVLIIKAYLNDFEHIENTFSKLIHWFNNCYIVCSPASALSGEVFIVMQNVGGYVLNPLRISGTERITYYSAKTCRDLRRFMQFYNRYAVGGNDTVRSLMIPCRIPVWKVAVLKSLPCHGLHKMAEVAKISVSSLLPGRNNYNNNIAKYIQGLLAAVEIYRQEIQGTLHSREAHKYDTMRHKNIITARLSAVSGCLTIMRSFSRPPAQVTETELTVGYHMLIDSLTMLPHLREIAPPLIYGELKVFGYPAHLYKFYTLGARWGVSIALFFNL